MGRALGIDLRLSVVRAIDEGLSTREAARRFAIGIATAGAWHRLWRRTDSVAPGRQGYPVRSKLDPHAHFIMDLVTERPDITLSEIAERLGLERGVAASRVLVWKFFEKRGVTFKKKSAHAAEQERPDVIRRRAAWFEHQLDLDPARLIFIDETGANTKTTRLRGRADRGERCRAAIPHGHWKTTTVTCGIRQDGLVAPFLIDGAMGADAFRAYVERVLVPELVPGDVVVTDNLATHKVAGIVDTIEATGASLLYLPPYSPDFNPIEQAFAKLKALLRKAAARTVADLWDAIAAGLDAFSGEECRNLFALAATTANRMNLL